MYTITYSSETRRLQYRCFNCSFANRQSKKKETAKEVTRRVLLKCHSATMTESLLRSYAVIAAIVVAVITACRWYWKEVEEEGVASSSTDASRIELHADRVADVLALSIAVPRYVICVGRLCSSAVRLSFLVGRRSARRPESDTSREALLRRWSFWTWRTKLADSSVTKNVLEFQEELPLPDWHCSLSTPIILFFHILTYCNRFRRIEIICLSSLTRKECILLELFHHSIKR